MSARKSSPATQPARTSSREAVDAAVLAAMEANPAASPAVLTEIVGLPTATVKAAQVRLSASGALVRVGSVLAHPTHEPQPHPQQQGLAAVERRSAILEWLQAEPIAPSRRELARAFGVQLGTIQNDLRLFKAQKVVEDSAERSPQHSLVVTGQPWSDPMRKWPTAVRPWAPPRESGEGAEAPAEPYQSDTKPQDSLTH